MKFLISAIFLALILISLFSLISKTEMWSILSFSAFECGFTSYFFSRFSFSIHYFLVGMIFLFLDLELILIMIFFLEPFSNLKSLIVITMVINLMLLGLLQEWKEKKLEWSV